MVIVVLSLNLLKGYGDKRPYSNKIVKETKKGVYILITYYNEDYVNLLVGKNGLVSGEVKLTPQSIRYIMTEPTIPHNFQLLLDNLLENIDKNLTLVLKLENNEIITLGLEKNKTKYVFNFPKDELIDTTNNIIEREALFSLYSKLLMLILKNDVFKVRGAKVYEWSGN